MDIPEQPKLEQITKKLAGILRIQDWDIKVHATTGYEVSKKAEDNDPGVDGLSVRDVRLNTADIYLNKEKDADWYETLVHELIHVQTTSMLSAAVAYFHERHSYFDSIYESLVERQAQVFCSVYPVTNFNDILGK